MSLAITPNLPNWIFMKHSNYNLRIPTRLVWRRKNLSKFKHSQLESYTVNFSKVLVYNNSNTIISLCVLNNTTPSLTNSRPFSHIKPRWVHSNLWIPTQFNLYFITSFSTLQKLHTLMAYWTTLACFNKPTILKVLTKKKTTSTIFMSTNCLL